MLQRYGRFIAAHARATLLIAGVALIAAAVVGFGAFGKLKNGGFTDPGAESTRAQQLIDDRFGGDPNLVLLVTARDGTVDSPAVRADATALAASLAREASVRAVVSYWSLGVPSLASKDHTEALILAHVTGGDNEIATRTETLLPGFTGDHGSISVRAGGPAGANHDVSGQVGKSLAVAESIAVPITMLLLVLAFGSVVSALIPLAIGGVAILGTFAELFVLGSVTDVSVFAINLTTALGLGLGIDYALLMVARYREFLAGGATVPDAVAGTVRTAGRTILFSAGTVAAALATLLVFPQFFLRSFAYAGIGVVIIAALAGTVVAPALLALLGTRINAGRVRWAPAIRGAESPFWGRVAGLVMRRPALTALPVLAALLLGAAPLLHVTFGTPDPGVLSTSAQSRQVADDLDTRFAADETTAIDVVSTGALSTDVLGGYARQLSRLPGVSHVDSAAGTATAGNLGAPTPAEAALSRPDARRLTVVSTLTSKSAAAQDLVRRVREVTPPAGASVLVGGVDAQLVDTKAAIGARLPLAIGLIVLTTFVLLFLFTGSVIQPLRALALNALSLSATLGVLTWIFQDGHLSGVLGFTARPMDTSMTVLLFCITFGLSMDYEVFLISRIKELHDAGAGTHAAVTSGLARMGRLVSTAAGLLAVSFFAFGTSSVSFLQMFGIGCGLAILIDATLIRGVLVPVVMRLLDRRIWYSPALLRPLATRLAIAEG